MADYVIHSPDWPTLLAYAATLPPGFYDAEKQQIIPQGPLPGGGAYFVNVAQDAVPTGKTIVDAFGNPAPEYKPLDGVWLRVRLNGENLFELGALPMPQPPIEVYPPTGTPGMPEGYQQPSYGMIA